MRELERSKSLLHLELKHGVPEWHAQVISERLDSYYDNPSQALDFESAIDDIEAGL